MADSKKSDSKASDAGEAEVQAAMDEAEEKGFFGQEVDPTPNEEYSLESETFNTPETDPDAAAKAAEATGALGAGKFGSQGEAK